MGSASKRSSQRSPRPRDCCRPTSVLGYPALMIRMLVMDYVFAIRSERLLCREGFDVSYGYDFCVFVFLGKQEFVFLHSSAVGRGQPRWHFVRSWYPAL